MPIDLEREPLRARVDRLRAVGWGAAPAGSSERGASLLHAYYERILPVWPDGGGKIMPNNAAVVSAYSSRLAQADLAELETVLESIVAAAKARKRSLGTMVKSLVRLVLVCSALRARGELDDAADPSEPLLELFEAGFDLNPTHGAVDLMDAKGMTSVPLPLKATVEARVRARASS